LSRVVNFEISTNDPERAVKFYGNVFKWKMEKKDPFEYWSVNTGNDEMSINGAIMLNKFDIRISNTIIVDNYDEFANKIEKAGGKRLSGIMYIPKLGVTGTFQDTEGNKFAIIEYGKKLKVDNKIIEGDINESVC
jgi:predicted enzyme related to lactoylglutathione lyase